jgi:hypothetical protein
MNTGLGEPALGGATTTRGVIMRDYGDGLPDNEDTNPYRDEDRVLGRLCLWLLGASVVFTAGVIAIRWLTRGL